jgi:hypothetical protein
VLVELWSSTTTAEFVNSSASSPIFCSNSIGDSSVLHRWWSGCAQPTDSVNASSVASVTKSYKAATKADAGSSR